MFEFIIGIGVGIAGIRIGKPILKWLIKKEAKLIKEIEKDAE